MCAALQSKGVALGASCGECTVQTRLRLVDDHTQMKSHEHSDVVDDSAGRGFDVPARLKAKVAMAHGHASCLTVESGGTAVCGRCRRARERECRLQCERHEITHEITARDLEHELRLQRATRPNDAYEGQDA